ncbi:MAG: GNAT family N-acetyltransferase, partial [Oscillospiraceae bacterium]|nr:GNAT family N-acetyltransferase [Oscillospiraceae bacterium]
QNAYHIWLKDEDGIVSYLRVLDKGVSFEDAALGRVISAKRRKGYGTILLKEGIRIAKEKFGADKITIEAQVYARKFYENVGFKKVSEEFLEDEIPHILMTLECE